MNTMSGLDLKRLVKTLRRADQIVSPRYEMWLLKGGIDRQLPPETADAVLHQLVTPQRDRSGSFSASSSGTCKRAQMYAYLDVPQTQRPGPELLAIFNNGRWTHLRLQAALLMAGVIERIEVPVRWRKMRAMGTADGEGYVPLDHAHASWQGLHFGLELKSAHPMVFARLRDEIMSHDGPLKYARQVTRYFTLGGFDLFAVFVEDKSNQETLEWVVEPNEQWIEEDREELEQLNWSVDNRRLPDRLPECRKLSGPTFHDCPYGGKSGACVQLTRYSEARKAGSK